MRSRNLLFACWGTYGEVFPITRLAAECQLLGHKVHLAANKKYSSLAAELRVAFAPLGPDRADLPTAAAPLEIVDKGLFGFLDKHVPLQTSQCEAAIAAMGKCDAMICGWLTPGALLTAEKRGIPVLFHFVYPLLLMQLADFPILPTFRRASHAAKKSLEVARKLYRVMQNAGESAFAEYFRLREDLGLPQYRGTIFEGPPNATRIALFSPHLLTTRKTNAPTALLGFVPHLAGPRPVPESVQSFLGTKKRVVLISFGSEVARVADELTGACCAAAVALGCRAIVLNPAYATVSLIGEDVLVVPECAPSALLPWCCAMITHGGIGTIHDALRAGRPILCIPHYGDQFDNAHRIENMGIGVALGRETVTEETVTSALALLLEEEIIRTRSSLWPMHLGEDRPIDRIKQLLNKL
jgi:UDP:flavonoid glycosyltransferase YjiC (YdhE family)